MAKSTSKIENLIEELEIYIGSRHSVLCGVMHPEI